MTTTDADDDTQELVSELRHSEERNRSALARVRERVAVSLTGPLGDLGDPHVAPNVAGVQHAGLLTAAKGAVLGAFALGAVVGAGGYAWIRPPTVQTVYRERAVGTAVGAAEARSSAATASPTTPPTPSLQVARAETAPRDVATALRSDKPAASAAVDDLVGELRLIDKARASFGAGDNAAALEGLRAHAKRYPHGKLEQEREALTVKALVRAGRFVDARVAGKRFAERYPSSALLDGVSAAVGTIP